MVVGEVGWSPAADRRADVLVGTDDNGEDDEEQYSVAVVKSVDDVVVVARAWTRQLGNRRQHSIHRKPNPIWTVLDKLFGRGRRFIH